MVSSSAGGGSGWTAGLSRSFSLSSAPHPRPGPMPPPPTVFSPGHRAGGGGHRPCLSPATGQSLPASGPQLSGANGDDLQLRGAGGLWCPRPGPSCPSGVSREPGFAQKCSEPGSWSGGLHRAALCVCVCVCVCAASPYSCLHAWALAISLHVCNCVCVRVLGRAYAHRLSCTRVDPVLGRGGADAGGGLEEAVCVCVCVCVFPCAPVLQRLPAGGRGALWPLPWPPAFMP